ncbi:MAG: translocation/assembly module TamB domain-containing protein [bacterium]|nr:translocation/assembly module TamB domain-containing protein [bacterium]
MKRRILAFFIVLVLTGATVGVKLAASPEVDRWLRRTIIDQAEKHLGVHASLGEIDRNFFLTKLSLSDVTLRDLKGSGKSITAVRMTVHIDPYAFIRGTLAIRDLRLEGLSLEVQRSLDGELLIEPLFPFWQRSGAGDGKIAPLRFTLGNVSLLDVDLTYTDVPGGLRVKLEDVVILLSRSRFDPPDRRSVSLRTKSGTLNWKAFPKGKDVIIRDLSGNFAVSRMGVQIARLTLDTGPLSVDMSGMMSLERNGEINAGMTIGLNLGQIPWAAEGTEGKVSLKGSMGGDLSDPSFRGQLEGRELRIADRVIDRISADVHLDTAGCEVINGSMRYRGQELTTGLTLGFDPKLPFEMSLEADGYPLRELMGEVGGEGSTPDGAIKARAVVSGQLSGGAADISLDGKVDVAIRNDLRRELDFSLSGAYAKMALSDIGLKVQWGGLSVDITGSVSGDGPALVIDQAGGSLSDLDAVPGLEAMEGELRLTGEISGQWPDAAARLDMEIDSPGWKGVAADLLQTHLDLDRSGLSLPMVTLRTGTTVFVGQAYLPFGPGKGEPWVGGEITNGKVEEILESGGVGLEVTGKVQGKFDATLAEEGWDGTGTLSLFAGRFLEESYDEITVSGSLAKGVLTAERIDLLKDGRLITGKGNVSEGRYEVEMHTEDPILVDGVRYLKIIRVPLAGELALAGKASGTLDGKELDARVDADWEQLFFEGRPWRGGEGNFRFKGSRLEAQAKLLDGDFAAEATADFRGRFPFSGTIRSPDKVDRDAINDLIGVRIPADAVSGWVSLTADAAGILKRISQTRVDGVITAADMEIKGVHFKSRDRIPFTYFPQTGIRFTELNLQSGESVLTGELGIAPDAGIGGNVTGSIDLKGLSFLEPTVDSFTGQADILIKVDGRLAKPLLNGSVRFAGASCVAHIPFDLPVTDLKGKLEIVGDQLHFGQIIGATGGGTILMGGELGMAGVKPVNGTLTWKAEGVPVSFPEGLETVDRADLSLRFSEDRGLLRGTVSMDEGVYRREVDIDNLIALISEAGDTGPGNKGPEINGHKGRWLGLDVGMETAAPITVDIKLMRGTATGTLHLRGTAAEPSLSGRMEVLEGTIEYRGHSFEVTSGSVGFFNPKRIEPSFDFGGRTEVTGFDREGKVRDYSVELLASGVPDRFRLELAASPALSEGDIISLLTWGAVGEQAFASRSGLSAAEATLLLTRELKGKLETEVERVTGFDRFVINPSSISSTGERTTRIQVDKKLSDKVYLTYSTPILTDEEQEVSLKYRISETFSLVGEQRGEKDYGLDLDFQFEIP